MSMHQHLATAADAQDASEVAREVLPFEDTWKVRDDLPFFDQRLLVDTAAQFVAASFQVRANQADIGSGLSAEKEAPVTEAVPVEAATDAGVEAGSEGPGEETEGLETPAPPSAVKPGSAGRGPGGPPKPKGGLQIRQLHAAVCHAHQFVGSERLAMELVPRCRPLKEQIQQTVHSICVAQRGSHAFSTEKALREGVDYEVERFLRARLVVCDLSDLMGNDCFAGGPVSSGLRNPDGSLRTRDSELDEDGGGQTSGGLPPVHSAQRSVVDDANGRRGQASLSQPSYGVLRTARMGALTLMHSAKGAGGFAAGGFAEAARKEAESEAAERLLELATKRFEHRFWRALCQGLGESLFGDASDAAELLKKRFEEAAQSLYERLQGELQLALHSLMGWLPSSVSDSLFLALVGLPAGVAVRQRSEKFAMLLNCVNSLVHVSGRYVFVSTPTWYLPLASRLGGLSRLHEIRQKAATGIRGRAIESLRSIWHGACLEPQDVIAAVDAVWGGRIPGVRAQRGLCGGAEAMGNWVLRMTLGFEGLLSIALQVLKDFAPRCEEAYDELVEEGSFQRAIDLPQEQTLACCLAAQAGEEVLRRARERRRQQSLLKFLAQRRTSEMPDDERTRASTAPPKLNVGAALSAQRGVISPSVPDCSSLTTADPTSSKAASSSNQQEPGRSALKHKMVAPAVDSFRKKPNLLQQLQMLGGLSTGNEREAGPTAAGNGIANRLRRSVPAGGGWWPLGTPGRAGGRLSIHDSPDLLPTAPPPDLEDEQFSLGAPAAGNLQVGGSSPSHGRLVSGVKSKAVALPPGDMEPMPRASTAPQLRHPKSFAEQLAEMASYSKHKKRAEIRGAGRSKSSPAAIDARDFDAGNVLKNTAVVLALQEELSLVLSGACHEGPLNLFWRQGATEEEGVELKRLRLSFGAILFFAAIRAPLPLESELPFKYFAATATMGVKEDKPPVAEARAADSASHGKNAPEKAGSGSRSGSKSTGRAALPGIAQSTSSRPPPKHSFEETVMPARKPLFMASLPDGMLAAGCSPIFHTMSTQAFSRTSPLVSNAFHIGVPQAMLEGPKLRDAMVERCGRGDSRWSIGSLVVLMSAAAVEEWQLDNQRWTTLNGWIRQEHNNFFATACCFRLLLGLEMANLYHSLRPSDKGARLCDILPFLRTVDSEVRNLDVVLDMSAAHGMRPLLRAPWVNVEAAGSLDFNPLFVEWGKEFSPGGLLKKSGVPLMDFASWVGHLRPGRIVYSTPLSAQCGDIYLRLKRAVVIIAFESSLGEIPLTGPDVYRKYRQAVGEVSWWGPKVKKVYYILLCSHLAPELLDIAADHDGCAEFEEATTVPGCRMGGRGPLHLMSKGSLRSVAPIVSQRSRELEDDGSGIFEDGAEEPDRSVSSIAKKRCLSDNDVKDGRVLLNSELFVCTSHWLDQLLGPLRNTVTAHRRIWESEITLESSGALQYQEDHARAEINRQRWYPSAAGKSAAARRPLAAKTQQLMLNFEALKATMEYVFTQTQSLQKLIADIRDNDSDDNSALGSAVSSRAPSPVPQVLPRLTGASCNDSTGPQPSAVSAAGYPSFTIVSSTSQKNLTGAPADEEHTEVIEDENEPEEEEGDSERELSNSTKLGSRWEHHRKTAKQLLHRYRRQSSRRGASRENQDEADCVLDEEGQEEDTFDGVGWMGNGVRLGRGCVRFQKRQFSPPRTGLSQKWRAPTPHPLQSPEVSQRSSRRLLEEERARLDKVPGRRAIQFDFTGFEYGRAGARAA